MTIFLFVAFCCPSKIWFRSIFSCRYSRRICFISKTFFYLLKIKMLSCLGHNTAHVCSFDTSYISYYLHMLSRSNRLRCTMEWLLLGIWSPVLPGKKDLSVIVFQVLSYCSDHNFPWNYDTWRQNLPGNQDFEVLISRGLNFPLHRKTVVLC